MLRPFCLLETAKMFSYIIYLFIWINFGLCQSLDGSIEFYLYNINYPNGVEINNLSLSELEIDPAQPLKIWFHGMTTNSTENWNEANTEAYINRGYNFIAVDYYDYSLGYITTIWQMDYTRGLIGDFLIKFCDELSVSFADIHMLGHSLGAHLAGQVGRYIYDKTNEKMGRITALDPPDFLFNIIYKDKQLNKTDALFVDAIHTSTLSVAPLGHADFYPDGGNVGDLTESETNSHMVVLDLYTESIYSSDFISRNCSTYISYLSGNCTDNGQAIMGENCDPSSRDSFFLNLNKNSPYAMGSDTGSYMW